jgi:hypothetical protein
MPSQGDNLSLGALGFACGRNGDTTSQTRLAEDCAGRTVAGASYQMSDFTISAIAGMTIPDDTPNESTSATATVTFSDAGTLFNDIIRAVNQNYTWAENPLVNPNTYILTTASDYTAPITYGSVASNTSIEFSVIYIDHYNTNATNYNSAITETAVIQNTGGRGG